MQPASRPIAAARAECLRRERNLIDALIATAKNDFDLDWTQERAEEALASYIKEHAVPLLRVSARGDELSAPAEPAGADYVVSSFVYNITQHDQRLFEYLDEMVKGSMLASALYMEISDVGKKFHKTTLYLDSPLCLKALGLEGAEAELAVLQVIAMATPQGAEIACFEHSVSAMRGVLDAALTSVRSGKVKDAMINY